MTVASEKATGGEPHGWRRISATLHTLSEAPSLQSTAKIAEYLAKIAAIVTVVWSAYSYLHSAPERTRQVDYAAWQLINAAHGQQGSSGRVEALEALAANAVPLDAVDVSGASLYQLRLPGASLRNANFSSTSLRRAVFDGTDLSGTNFRNVTMVDERDRPTIGDVPPPTTTSFLNAALSATDFSGKANLAFSDFRVTRNVDDPKLEPLSPFRGDGFTKFDGASIEYSRFDGRHFNQTSFLGASAPESTFFRIDASQSDFRYADLSNSNFADAKLSSVDFTGACLMGAKFERTLLDATNFTGSVMSSNTDFRGARYADKSRDAIAKSIRRAIGYDRAKFDAPMKEAITRKESGPQLRIDDGTLPDAQRLGPIVFGANGHFKLQRLKSTLKPPCVR